MGTRWQAAAADVAKSCSLTRPAQLPSSIRKRLAFFAFISMDEPAVLEHWLAWYAWLGVDFKAAGRATIVVHVPPGETSSPNARATLKLLKTAAVGNVTHTPVYSSHIKQTMVNAYLATLPRDALLLYPDGDEFFARAARAKNLLF